MKHLFTFLLLLTVSFSLYAQQRHTWTFPKGGTAPVLTIDKAPTPTSQRARLAANCGVAILFPTSGPTSGQSVCAGAGPLNKALGYYGYSYFPGNVGVLELSDGTGDFSKATVLISGNLGTDVFAEPFFSASVPANLPYGTQYKLRIRLTNQDNCLSNEVGPFTISPKPDLSVSNPGAVCAPNTVNLTSGVSSNASGATFSYFSDAAATQSVGNPAAVGAGTYYVRATAGGCTSDLKPITATVNAKPELTVNSPAAVCAPNTVNLTSGVSSNVSGATFSYFSDAAATQSVGNPAAVGVGIYYVRATANGCTSDLKPITAIVKAKPDLTIGSLPAVCAPGTVNLTGGVSGVTTGATVIYFSDQAATQSVGNPAAVGAGTYYVRAILSGCTSDLKPITATVNAKPELTVTSPGAVCAPNTVNLTSGVSGVTTGATVSYYSDQAATQSVGNPAAVGAGTYYVRASLNSCLSDLKPITATVKPLPQNVTLTNNGPLSANKPTVTLSASSSTGGVTYAFQGVNATGPSTATVNTSGTFTVIASLDGCSVQAQTLVYGANSPSACRGTSTTIYLTATGAPVRYEWYIGVATGQPLRDGAYYQGATTANLKVVSVSQSQVYYAKAFYADGSSVVYGPYRVMLNTNCGAREAASVEPGTELRITLLGNPLQGEALRALVQGAAGQRLLVELVDQSGRSVRSQVFDAAESAQAVEWNLNKASSGIYLLQAVSGQQRQTAKVVKP